tara:strand:- start:80 stop:577 length:498 start_codon:yes stop_codon:yes gene_type:complete
MKKLLALLLLPPLAFTETTDLHCVSLEDLPEGKLRNKLISLDVTNEVVWMLNVNFNKSINKVVNLREMNKKIEVSTSQYKWKGFVRKTPDEWQTEYTDDWWIGRETLKLSVIEFYGNLRWSNFEQYQCEIIDNKNEKLNYYKNEEMKWDKYSQKRREERLKKNKI